MDKKFMEISFQPVLRIGMKQSDAFMNDLMNMGVCMLQNGAEVKRVEETLTRMGLAYGAERMDVFVITSCIFVTMVQKDGNIVSQTRRIRKSGGTDFGKLEELNELSRRYCAEPFSPEELRERGRYLSGKEKELLKSVIGSFIGAGGFAVFFGGNLMDGLLAGIFGIMICLLQRALAPIAQNRMIENFLCSFITGILTCLVCRFAAGTHMDKIMIADIMLLIPGIAFTNSIKDILVGDTISGIMRIIETIMWAVSIACGFVCAVWLIGV